MEINNIIDASISLNRVLNRAVSKNRGGLTLRIQVLLCAKKHNGVVTVKQIMDDVKIVKTNLAILCNDLCNEQYLQKVKNQVDMRTIKYQLLEKGQKEIDDFLSSAKNCFEKILSEQEQAKLNSCAIDIIKILE